MPNAISRKDHELTIRELQKEYTAKLARIARIQEAENYQESSCRIGINRSSSIFVARKIVFSPNIHFPDQEFAAKILVGSDSFVGSE